MTDPSASAGSNNQDQTLVCFTLDPTIEFWEIAVTPPGVDGMAAIETTNMHTNRWRTFSPRRLVTLTEFSTTAQYDPHLYVSILTLVNINTTVTVRFPDASTLAFYGYLMSFKPGALEDGKKPECSLQVTPTNEDPVYELAA